MPVTEERRFLMCSCDQNVKQVLTCENNQDSVIIEVRQCMKQCLQQCLLFYSKKINSSSFRPVSGQFMLLEEYPTSNSILVPLATVSASSTPV